MKKWLVLTIVGIFLAAGAAEAQFAAPGYNRVQNGGSNLTRRRTLNCGSGITCADDAANSRTNMVVTGAGAADCIDEDGDTNCEVQIDQTNDEIEFDPDDDGVWESYIPNETGAVCVGQTGAGCPTAGHGNGANCSAGSAPLGVDGSGAVEGCTDYEEDLANSAGLLAALSDETGTGLAVFGTDPTFSNSITLSGLSAASVLLAGTAGVVEEDTTGLNFDTTDNQLFVNRDGTNPPLGANEGGVIANRNVWVIGNDDANFRAIAYGTASTPQLIGYKARGSEGSETIVVDGDELLQMRGQGYDGDSWVTGGVLLIEADGTWTQDVSTPTRFVVEMTPSGSQTQAEVFRLSNAGLMTLTTAGTTPSLTFAGSGGSGTISLDSTVPEFRPNAVWRMVEDLKTYFGPTAGSGDWSLEYDEDGDDQLLFATTKTAAVDVGDPMFQILVGTTPTADQDVFGVAKGTQGSNTDLFVLDEDGDAEFGGVVTISGGADTLVGKATTDTLTNKTLDVEATGNVVTTVDPVHMKAAGCNNTTASPMFDLPTANAPAVACDTGSNVQRGVLNFDDSTDESAQASVVLPADFSGAIDVEYWWTAAATSGAVGWCTQLICIADSEAKDPAFPAQGAANCVSGTVDGTTTDMNRTTDTSITATGCAASELMQIRWSRDADGGAVTDDMTGDASLLEVLLTMRRAQ